MIRFTALVAAAIFMMTPHTVFAQGAANASPAPAEFFTEMQDIPLVPGIREVTDQTVTFDKPEGRIVESVAEIENGDSTSVEKAYEETLPQLGWAKISDNLYAREEESLTLNFERYEGRNFVRIMVRPKDDILN